MWVHQTCSHQYNLNDQHSYIVQLAMLHCCSLSLFCIFLYSRMHNTNTHQPFIGLPFIRACQPRPFLCLFVCRVPFVLFLAKFYRFQSTISWEIFWKMHTACTQAHTPHMQHTQRPDTSELGFTPASLPTTLSLPHVHRLYSYLCTVASQT